MDRFTKTLATALIVIGLGGLAFGSYLAVSSSDPKPTPAAVSVEPTPEETVRVPTTEALTTQVEKDIDDVVAGRLVKANKSLDEFKTGYPDCLWANQQGVSPDPRSAGAQIDNVIGILRGVAPRGELVAGATTLTVKNQTYWILLAVSCGRE